MNRYRIPSLARACQALKMFAGSDERLSASEVGRRLAIPRTTALRVLLTLCEEGLLVRDGNDYRAGGELLRLGVRALEALPLRARATPVLRDLAAATGETSHLAILAGDQSLILEVCDSPNPVRAASRPGTLAALHCSATGKALLAFSPPDRLAERIRRLRLLRRTPSSITTARGLLAACAEIARRGYAVDDEEYHPGVRCLAAPVFATTGEAFAAIGVTASTTTFTKRRIPEIAAAVVRSARALSEAAPSRPLQAVG